MARKDKSLPNSIKIWTEFVAIYVEVFSDALNILQITDDIKSDENAITIALCPKLRMICFAHNKSPNTPNRDPRISPVIDDEISSQFVDKRPDFICSFVDPNADTVEMYEIDLHIECKRLGIKKSSWDLNMNYINNGINRFDLLTHEYGKRANDGIMIGYIISSTKLTIQKEINSSLPSITSLLI
jgi:hypothetical protein